MPSLSIRRLGAVSRRVHSKETFLRHAALGTWLEIKLASVCGRLCLFSVYGRIGCQQINASSQSDSFPSNISRPRPLIWTKYFCFWYAFFFFQGKNLPQLPVSSSHTSLATHGQLMDAGVCLRSAWEPAQMREMGAEDRAVKPSSLSDNVQHRRAAA